MAGKQKIKAPRRNIRFGQEKGRKRSIKNGLVMGKVSVMREGWRKEGKTL